MGAALAFYFGIFLHQELSNEIPISVISFGLPTVILNEKMLGRAKIYEKSSRISHIIVVHKGDSIPSMLKETLKCHYEGKSPKESIHKVVKWVSLVFGFQGWKKYECMNL